MVMPNRNALSISPEDTLSDRDQILLQCATGVAYYWHELNCLRPELKDFGIKMLYGFAKVVEMFKIVNVMYYKLLYCGYLRRLGKQEIAESLKKVSDQIFQNLREIVQNKDKIKEYSTFYNIIVSTNKSYVNTAIKCTSFNPLK
ncbi:unnamed protein product [Bursaphelenchus okinawaensis]|uniref:Uncharacterized protein n=1 Tax=Bursaphelenchus okinawaensis TaxID=465554 RepID=A0A811L578_9BILA|nr:unnamed protein product [Bursaphelenchus okinawaensis]CAG9116886.1 unnamed protein product [Bursaphelenchus okinawaensis]